MKRKISVLAVLTVAGLFATPVRADTLVKVTVLAPDGGPAAGVAVTVRQAAGYGIAADNVEPPATVAAGATGGDGTVNLRLADVRPYDVYSIGADDEASDRIASTVVFAGETRWPAPVVTLGEPASAINLERVAAGKAAASCDQAAYATHVQQIREAVDRQQRSLAALENAIAQYARASDLAASNIDAARTQLATAQQQPGAADRVAMLQHYVLLRLLADNMRAGLEADRVSAQSIATLQLCSNEGKAGVQMLPRCPPGWQTRLQNAQSDSNCHQRTSGTGREQN
jgi:exonuclease VII small subunit